MSELDQLTRRPEVVDADEWQRRRDDLLVEEKRLTRELDALAARRRRLPMVRFDGGYVFEGPNGQQTLLQLFGEHRELAVYQFMDVGPESFCPGCTYLTDNVTALERLSESDIAWVNVSDMPLEQMTGYWRDRGWDVPYFSSRGTTFSVDCGAGGGFLLSLFLRDGEEVFRTYSTTQRGVDRLLFANNVADLAVFGRRQDWEDSPDGWPQSPTYG